MVCGGGGGGGGDSSVCLSCLFGEAGPRGWVFRPPDRWIKGGRRREEVGLSREWAKRRPARAHQRMDENRGGRIGAGALQQAGRWVR